MKQMRSYLDLVRVSARARKRESLMTRLCILLAVYLVAAIFTMADMQIRAQRRETIQSMGSWHVVFGDVDEEQIAVLRARPEVVAASRYIARSGTGSEGYTIAGRNTAVAGCDENFTLEIRPGSALTEGRWPQTPKEAVISENARQNGIALGDTVTLATPRGDWTYTVCGFTPTTALLGLNDALGLLLTPEGVAPLFADEAERQEATALYLQLSEFCNMNKAIADMQARLDIPADNTGCNNKLMTLGLQARQGSYLQMLYGVAAVLGVLVLAAGVLMITGMLNSSIANRTQFFGLLRCLGATPRQVMAYVRREALQWCAGAVPLGLALAAVTSWALCALLKFLAPDYFAGMQVFEISPVGLGCGALAGLLTVLLAARSPAKRAARTSPLTAVSGNAVSENSVRMRLPLGRQAEVALGIHHATGSKKNLLLIAGSFALSIVLFLGFSSLFDFINHAVRVAGPDAPDLVYTSIDDAAPLDAELVRQLYEDPAVRRLLVQNAGMETAAPLAGEEQLAQPWQTVGVQLERAADEQDVTRLRALTRQGVNFVDKRQDNQEARGMYLAVHIFVYGFLAVIALIAVLGIFNQLAMSAAARTRQYGAMRAIGLSGAQLHRMLLAEAAVYAGCGCGLGLAAGLPLHRWLFITMVTSRWGDAWTLPVRPLAFIAALVAASALLAVRGPARRLEKASVVESVAAP